MGSRITAGAAVAALPLATALWAASEGRCVLGVFSVIGVGAVLLLAVAPWLPLLHALRPPLGAAKADISFRKIPSADHTYPGVVVEVGVKASTRLEAAGINFCFPRDVFGPVGVRRLHVAPSEEQNILPPRDFDSSTAILWWAGTQDLHAGSTMFWFQMAPMNREKPCQFKVTMLVAAEVLYQGEATADFAAAYEPPEPETD